MRNKQLKFFLKKELKTYLVSSRKKAGISIKVAAQQLGHDSEAKLATYESNGNIPSRELVRISEIYKIPQIEFSAFLVDLQLKALAIIEDRPSC